MDDTIQSAKNMGVDVLKAGEQFAVDLPKNLGKLGNVNVGDVVNKVTRSTKRTVNQTRSIAHKVIHNPRSLTLTQVLIVFGVLAIVGSFVIAKVASYYEEHLPEFLAGLIKFLIYLVLPLATASGCLFGMYLEHQYGIFPDTMQKLDATFDYVGSWIDYTVQTVRSYL